MFFILWVIPEFKNIFNQRKSAAEIQSVTCWHVAAHALTHLFADCIVCSAVNVK